MDYNYKQTEFSKSLFAGFFAGFIAVLLSLIYNVVFRKITGLALSGAVYVLTINFFVILTVTIAGLFFYLFHHYLKKNGTPIFRVVVLIFTLLSIAGITYVQRSSNPILSSDFRELLIGIIIIASVSIMFIIPFLYRRNYF